MTIPHANLEAESAHFPQVLLSPNSYLCCTNIYYMLGAQESYFHLQWDKHSFSL